MSEIIISFEIDDDFVFWAKKKGIDLRKKQKKTPEVMLFQSLYKEILLN